MKKERLNSLIRYTLLIFVVFSNINLSAQQIISRDLNDYPEGTIKVPEGCIGVTGNLCSYIKLKPTARFNKPFYYTIPLLHGIDTFILHSIIPHPDTLEFELDSFQVFNQIRLFVTRGWNNIPEYDHYVEFTYWTKNNSLGIIDQQTFRANIVRDTLQVVLVLDISESMDSIIEGTSNSKFDILKDGVNALVHRLSYIRQVPDSIGLTYYNSNVIQPNPTNFPNNFIKISHPFQPPTTASIFSDDLSLRTSEGSTALGEGLLNAKNKLSNYNSPYIKKIIFLFSDGLQDAGNKLNLDGTSFNSSTDSLNNMVEDAGDSIIYITVSTTKAADVTPLMAAIPHRNNGTSLSIDGSSSEFQNFLDNQLDSILHNYKARKVAVRIIDLNPRNDSLNIDVNQNLNIYFNENVNINTGSIFIMRSADDSEFEEIEVTTGSISGNETSVITINPVNELESETEYYILIDENAFSGVSGNAFAGITSKDYWNFTTEDTEEPSVILSAENDTTGTADFDTYVNFSEMIRGFSNSKISVTNGAVSNLSTSDSVDFVATIDAISQGEIDIIISENQVTDLSGNYNTASNSLKIVYHIQTSIDELKRYGIFIYSYDGYIMIDFTDQFSTDQTGIIKLYSLTGELILNEKITGGSKNKYFIGQMNKVYIVDFLINKRHYSFKLNI